MSNFEPKRIGKWVLGTVAISIGTKIAVSFAFSQATKALGYGPNHQNGFETQMTRNEAAKILNVKKSSSHDKIKEAHLKLIYLNHPDRGGSEYLSSKINQAKDLLISGKSNENSN
ncbi:hypothetical protein M0811_06032 [Anaeramoeba ignava]|uniref:J domain-containing protein n=1 Tax=Anaeramoeba ignava TaxID=1746090 RepID=A0A9Q0LS34_ANAIG|nr:hypothetical protein M0811_06032 [Anaeramoeba ignava]|eukprot:Anaeramoba_ignava/a357651_124.p1 GENE.a357651_124~~a357651_124.p1  ORF type:complete len:124 (+),score=39.01 a357651_124:30-374(+)